FVFPACERRAKAIALGVGTAVRLGGLTGASPAQVLGGGSSQHRRSAELPHFFVGVEPFQEGLVEQDLYWFHVDSLSSCAVAGDLRHVHEIPVQRRDARFRTIDVDWRRW